MSVWLPVWARAASANPAGARVRAMRPMPPAGGDPIEPALGAVASARADLSAFIRSPVTQVERRLSQTVAGSPEVRAPLVASAAASAAAAAGILCNNNDAATPGAGFPWNAALIDDRRYL